MTETAQGSSSLPREPLVDLVTLAQRLQHAKDLEATARQARVLIESAIVKRTGFVKTEGQETFKDENETGRAKLVLKQPINTTVDSDGWRKLRRTLPAGHPLRSVFRQKFEVDAKVARKVQDEHPEAWALLAADSIVTRKPGKVSVELAELDVIQHTEPCTVCGEVHPDGELVCPNHPDA